MSAWEVVAVALLKDLVPGAPEMLGAGVKGGLLKLDAEPAGGGGRGGREA